MLNREQVIEKLIEKIRTMTIREAEFAVIAYQIGWNDKADQLKECIEKKIFV